MRTGNETIIALATPPGIGALSIIRLSGNNVREMTERLLGKNLQWTPRQARFLKLKNGETHIDDCIAVYWQAPHSYTGEDVLELYTHGNPKIVELAVKAYLQQGARLALPGEFTRRALESGKIDLTHAEGLLDLFHASTERELANARAMLRGDLSAQIRQARENLIDLMAQLEAYIDFPEEDIDPPTLLQLHDHIDSLMQQFTNLASTASEGKVLREGVVTAIVGKPNVGKSSLFNLLLREQRAITSPKPGTTRDLIDAECIVAGLRLRLIDTAGLRTASDEIEALGIEKTRTAWDQAQLILHVVAADEPPEEDHKAIDGLQLRPDQQLLKILNKSDLPWHPHRKPEHFDCIISTIRGDGIDSLQNQIQNLYLCTHNTTESASICLINARQNACLENAIRALSNAKSSLTSALPPEIIAQDLRLALSEIDEILGVTDHDEILNKIFSQFCIGK
jgi:tRNA modification GTPase